MTRRESFKNVDIKLPSQEIAHGNKQYQEDTCIDDQVDLVLVFCLDSCHESISTIK